MFSEKLSASLQRILELRKLNYETASELCDMSSKHFGNIARGDSSPTIEFFEKLCAGLDKTPNELLGYPSDEQLSFRHPKSIKKAYCFHLPESMAIYAVCPQCAHLTVRNYTRYCCNCGQALSWDSFDLKSKSSSFFNRAANL